MKKLVSLLFSKKSPFQQLKKGELTLNPNKPGNYFDENFVTKIQ